MIYVGPVFFLKFCFVNKVGITFSNRTLFLIGSLISFYKLNSIFET